LITNETKCIFERKNDILSVIEDILICTKDEQNTWFNDPGLTMMASATLLKLGYNERNLSIDWIESQIKADERRKDYQKSVQAFSHFSLGLLALYLAKRNSKRSLLRFISKSVSMLKSRNWMNNAKTTLFVVLPLKEAFTDEEIPRRSDFVGDIETYLATVVGDPNSSNENLAYALFSLSFIDPSKVREFLEKRPELRERLIQHRNVEIKAVSLQTFDRAGIPCAESVYRAIWNHFQGLEYGKVEKTILSRITEGVYNTIAGSGTKVKELEIETKDNEARLTLTMPIASLEQMVKSIPPLDQLCLVALCILFSNYRTLFLLTQPKLDEYNRLQNLDNRLTHMPVRKDDLTRISKAIYRYQRYGILVSHVFFPVSLFVGSILFSYFITPHVQQLQSPFRETLVALPPFVFGGASLYSVLMTVKDRLGKARKKTERLRSEGAW
jgi:hypothetical protein